MHGFNSSPLSGKARVFAGFCASEGVACAVPQLAHRPAEAIATTERLIRAGGVRTVIGSSMGGYYATYLCEKVFAGGDGSEGGGDGDGNGGLRAVLINPAVKLAEKLAGEVGKTQKNYHNGEEYLFTETHLAEFAALETPAPTCPQRYLLLAQTGDEVLDYREAAAFYRGAEQVIEEGGDHSFVGFESQLRRILDFHLRGGAETAG